MKHQIAYNQRWAVPVTVDHEGNIFYQATPLLKLPFVTEDKYELADFSNLQEVLHKVKMLGMKNTILEKQVAESYSPSHLEKYFKAFQVDTPEIALIQKIILKYQDFLEVIFSGKNEWYEKNQELNKKQVFGIERDLQRIQLFMEYYNSDNK